MLWVFFCWTGWWWTGNQGILCRSCSRSSHVSHESWDWITGIYCKCYQYVCDCFLAFNGPGYWLLFMRCLPAAMSHNVWQSCSMLETCQNKTKSLSFLLKDISWVFFWKISVLCTYHHHYVYVQTIQKKKIGTISWHTSGLHVSLK